MNSIPKILLLLLALCICSAESAHPLGQFCNSDTNIKSGSKISANIDRLLSALISKTSSNGFTSTSYGKGKDKVFGLAQCRGDVGSTDCTSCIQDAAKQIRHLCPNEADARIWYDFCFLRYNNKSFIGDLDTSFGIFYWNVANVTDPKTFNKDLGALMDEVRKDAVEPKNEGLGKGDTKVSPFVTVYALVQCTRDLAPLDCAQCLATAVENFETFCSNRKGCRVLYSSCYVRYEIYPFFFPLNSNNDNKADTLMAIVYP
ncbi:cysteine-rich repeat secretory protein 55-like [Corylus avellana]|uniref:cysteine-rich repeat secretory protein 55-like n=1 Tax=Corylus avellana TaxID=13451 RepID=UPI00286B561E|nr:cysteine-rich repeat secretory protein 55-like [Corylus avellana]